MKTFCSACGKTVTLQGGVVTKYLCTECTPADIGTWYVRAAKFAEIWERVTTGSVFIGSYNTIKHAEEACSYHNLPEGKKRWKNCADQEGVEIDSTWIEGKVEDGLCYAEEYGDCYDYTEEEFKQLQEENRRKIEARDTITFPSMMVTSTNIGMDDISKVRDLLRDFIKKTRIGG